MDFVIKSDEQHNESSNDVSDVGIAAAIAIKVEPESSCSDNSTSHIVSSSYEAPLKSEEAVEPVPYHNYVEDTGENGISNPVMQKSNESALYSERPSCDLHEFNNVSCVVDTSASVTVKIEPEESYLGNATFVSCEASTDSKNSVALPLNDFNGQTVFTKQKKIEDMLFKNDIKNEISDKDFLEITSILEEYDHDLRSQSLHNPTLEAGTRKFHVKSEESDMNCENKVLNGTEGLSCDCNRFVNSVDQGVCNNVKTINIKNCSVLLKRLDITSLKTIRVNGLQDQKKIYLDSHFNQNEQKIFLQGSVSDRICNNTSSFRKHNIFSGNSFQCLQVKNVRTKCRNQNHMEGHEPIRSNEKCLNKLRLKSKLVQYNLIHSGKNSYECSDCDQKFRTNSHLKRHKLIHSPKIRYECLECKKKFTMKQSLEQHKLMHLGIKPYECSECLKKFRRKYHLEQHKLLHSGKKSYECSECDQKFTQKQGLEGHKLIHSSKKPYECSECLKKFRRKYHLEQHKLIHSDKKSYECLECEKKFTLKQSLEEHKLMHLGKKPCECAECLKKFSRKSTLEQHKLIHSGKKPYECSECVKKFSRKSTLEQHKLIHLGKVSYECSECLKIFSRKFTLEQHKVIHSGRKPYECSECSKKFRRKYHLQQHQLIHSGKMSYEQ